MKKKKEATYASSPRKVTRNRYELYKSITLNVAKAYNDLFINRIQFEV